MKPPGRLLGHFSPVLFMYPPSTRLTYKNILAFILSYCQYISSILCGAGKREKITVVTTPSRSLKGRRSYQHGQAPKNGVTILLRLKDYKIGELQGGEEKGPLSIT